MTSARAMVRVTPPPGGPPSPRPTMGVLVNCDSSDVSAPRGSGDDDAPGPQQQKPIPDADAIISETMAEMEQARLKADQLICQFAETYVASAGQLREGAIERYRERLEGLPADVAAKICETLAKDDIFCCNMEFGSGHMSFGGMSFTYKVDSDTAFNALSHHAWKDLHQVFAKASSSSAHLHDILDQDGQFDVDELEMVHEHSRRSASSESDESSDSESSWSTSSDDSSRPARPRKRRRSSASLAPSPDWISKKPKTYDAAPWSAEEETIMRTLLETTEKSKLSACPYHVFPDRSKDSVRGKWRHMRQQAGLPFKKRAHRPGISSAKPWTAAEDRVMREKMLAQRQAQPDIVCAKDTVSHLLELLPGRSFKAIDFHWRAKWPEWTGKTLSTRAKTSHVKEDVSVKRPLYDTVSEQDSDELTEDDDDSSGAQRGKRQVPGISSWIMNKWTPDQDQLILDRLHTQMQSTGGTRLKDTQLPTAVIAELAEELGRKSRNVRRRMVHVKKTSSLLGSHKRQDKPNPDAAATSDKATAALPSIAPGPALLGRMVDVGLDGVTSADELTALSESLSPAPVTPSKEKESPKAEKSDVYRPGPWTSEEIETLLTLTKGKDLIPLRDIDFKSISAQIPGPGYRSPEACREFWKRNRGLRKPSEAKSVVGLSTSNPSATPKEVETTSTEVKAASKEVGEAGECGGGPVRKVSRPARYAWTAEEVKTLTRLTRGKRNLGERDFEKISSQMPPGPAYRPARACHRYWSKNLRKLLVQDVAESAGSVQSDDEDLSDVAQSSPMDVTESHPSQDDKSDPASSPAAASEHGSPSRDTAGSLGSGGHASPAPEHDDHRRKPGRPRLTEQPKTSFFRHWTKEEDETLLRLRATGMSFEEVATQISGRTMIQATTRHGYIMSHGPTGRGKPGRPPKKRGRKPSEVTDVEEDEASDDLSSEDEGTELPAKPASKQSRSIVVHKTKQTVAPRKRRRDSDGGAYPLRQRREEVGEQSVRDHDGSVWDYE